MTLLQLIRFINLTSSTRRRLVFVTSSDSSRTQLFGTTVRSPGIRLTHGLGPEVSAVGVTDYEYERKKVSLGLPRLYNFANDVIDHWARLEQVRHRNGLQWNI